MNNSTAALSAVLLAANSGASHAAESVDPFLWLEEVHGEKAIDWVKAQNAQSSDYLKKVSTFDQIYQDSLTILNAEDRLAHPTRRGQYYYNFWQDSTHVKGIYRRTSAEEYRKPEPKWETVIDFDALAKADKEDWVFKGTTCLEPGFKRCMIALSRGGADAIELREFDLDAKQFVKGGFVLPEAKTGVTWVDADHLLVGTDYGEGTLTTSGYPRVIKLWQRGTPLTEAKTVFEAEPESFLTYGSSYRDSEQTYTLINKGKTFFTFDYFLYQKGEAKPLTLPEKLDIAGVFQGDLFFMLREDLIHKGQTFASGSIVYASVASLLTASPDYQLFVKPAANATVNGLEFTANHVVVNWLEDVTNRVSVYQRDKRDKEGQWLWASHDIPLEQNGKIHLFNASSDNDDFFVEYSSFLTPPSFYQVTPENGKIASLKASPLRFDADAMEVKQHFVASKDGTRVPYFIIHQKGLKLDGTNPTILYGYGGFQLSMEPFHSSLIGKNWLERGGVFVLSNIRGGGEYGPDWHQAALQHNRHKAYEDFEAIAEDLITRKITSPKHLGIQGGSNGGLLVGAAVTRRPELYNAVVCQVPLLDMKRFNKLLAGASWMAEYGNPDEENDWAYLKTYSPYHNVLPEVEYPKVFFTTSTRDDRVHPAHARKMVALMQAQGHDVLYYENMEGGHAGASNNNSRAELYAQTYSYLIDRLF
ncbi:prolyl oligopeptidase family serine peptidase [Photobacterium aphoticum]|uniref:Prolyl oligopeptidase n=2 Tax=Photobacterium aphoticum TaxID=754436 RepID=A0A0J1GR40_9GAMM|nr:prolyl oligopeptidase family serine peptidase [Photobacterium aphoticum]KLV02131.1 prolyl oligopeptidase [Photobacterium aphoticum]PSU59346.1 S9 family peptidase [Photobacterium aphoticum]GHA31794.1 prolyl oligopeptidase [Photobacterium aphoticum]